MESSICESSEAKEGAHNLKKYFINNEDFVMLCCNSQCLFPIGTGKIEEYCGRKSFTSPMKNAPIPNFPQNYNHQQLWIHNQKNITKTIEKTNDSSQENNTNLPPNLMNFFEPLLLSHSLNNVKKNFN